MEPRRSLSRFDALLDVLDRPRSGIALFVIAGGLISLAMGVDVNWDLKNYHFYNAWAWLNDRIGWDYAPAQLQSYYNPLLDLAFYGLARADVPAAAVSFVMGVPYGCTLYLFYRIARIAVADAGVARVPLALATIGIVSVTAAAGLSVAGSTMNDWSVALPVVASLYLIVVAVRRGDDVSPRAVGAAGLLAGVAMGMKFTAAPFALAVFVGAVTCLHGRDRYARGVIAFVVFALIGLMASYGYWATLLWKRFDNPVFPYFNALFRSEYWDAVNFHDERFRFKRLNVWITLPFKLAQRNTLVSEAELRDPRLAFLLVFALVLLIAAVARARSAKQSILAVIRGSTPSSIRLLIVFAIVSYLAWLALFRIYRYAIPLELVASLLLVLAMRSALAGAVHRDALVATFVVSIVVGTAVPDWGRAPPSLEPYFRVRVPALERNALVMLFTGGPVGYVVPFIDPSARVIRPASNFTGPGHANRLQREIDQIAKTFDGPMYVIRFENHTDPTEDAMLAGYRLRRRDDACRPVESNMERDDRLVVCPLARTGA